MIIPHLYSSSDSAQQISGCSAVHLDLAGSRKGRGSMLVTGQQVDNPEPLCQRQVGTVHDAVGRERGLVTATGTLILSPASDPMTVPVAVYGTLESPMLLDLMHVFFAGFFVGKTVYGLTEIQGFFVTYTAPSF